MVPWPLGAGPLLPARHPWVSHQAPDFCNFGLAEALWDPLPCLPPLAPPTLRMAAQEPLAGGLSPLPGVQTVAAPRLGFPSCLMAAGASNLSCGPSRASRARGGSAIPAMCPRSRDQQPGETLSRRAPRELSSRGQSRGEAPGPLGLPAIPRRHFCCCACQTAASPPAGRQGAAGMGSTAMAVPQQQVRAAWWHLQQQGTVEVVGSTPAPGDGGQPPLAAGCRAP